MIIDIIAIIIFLLAIKKGYQRGLIVGIFSFVAIIIGLAAAIKLSTVVAKYIGSAVNVSEQWLPVISFAVVFIVIVLLIRLGANAIEKAVEMVTLGWVNKLGGIVFYAAIYTVVFSVFLFFATRLQLLKTETTGKSVSYAYIQPIGQKVIDGLGAAIPIFKDMFAELEVFFDGVAKGIDHP